MSSTLIRFCCQLSLLSTCRGMVLSSVCSSMYFLAHSTKCECKECLRACLHILLGYNIQPGHIPFSSSCCCDRGHRDGSFRWQHERRRFLFRSMNDFHFTSKPFHTWTRKTSATPTTMAINEKMWPMFVCNAIEWQKWQEWHEWLAPQTNRSH